MLSSHLMPFTGDMKFGFTDFDHIGWLLCDGRTLNVSDYNQLFQIVGYTYGGTVGGATFKLPDMRGRVPGAINPASNRSPNTALSVRNKNDAVGAETHTLTIPEMPSHNHGVAGGGQGATNNATSSNGSHTHTVNDVPYGTQDISALGGGALTAANETTKSYTTESAGAHTHTLNPAGGDQPHNNMQPTLFVGNMFVYCGNFKIGRRRGDYSGQPI